MINLFNIDLSNLIAHVFNTNEVIYLRYTVTDMWKSDPVNGIISTDAKTLAGIWH